MKQGFEIRSRKNNELSITAYPGHFVTSHSHINYYIDITQLKHRHMMARHAARELSSLYVSSTPVDTIVCMDGSEMIGAFLASELGSDDFMAVNTHKSINVITPEFNANNQLIFRDNLQPMVNGKNIILLIASVTTGKTLKRTLECMNYYAGRVQGICAVFSAIPEIQGVPIHSIFTPDDIPNYSTASMRDCEQCKNHVKIDALVNSYGYSQI